MGLEFIILFYINDNNFTSKKIKRTAKTVRFYGQNVNM